MALQEVLILGLKSKFSIVWLPQYNMQSIG